MFRNLNKSTEFGAPGSAPQSRTQKHFKEVGDPGESSRRRSTSKRVRKIIASSLATKSNQVGSSDEDFKVLRCRRAELVVRQNSLGSPVSLISSQGLRLEVASFPNLFIMPNYSMHCQNTNTSFQLPSSKAS